MALRCRKFVLLTVLHSKSMCLSALNEIFFSSISIKAFSELSRPPLLTDENSPHHNPSFLTFTLYCCTEWQYIPFLHLIIYTPTLPAVIHTTFLCYLTQMESRAVQLNLFFRTWLSRHSLHYSLLDYSTYKSLMVKVCRH